MGATLLGALGFLALLLASIGIYGVMSFAVNQRNREIGIRMALGAQQGQVLQLFLRQGLLLVAAGAAIGIVAAVVISRLISNLLYVSPTDPQTFVLTTLVLAAVALLASFIPARRATTVDPVIVLRYE